MSMCRMRRVLRNREQRADRSAGPEFWSDSLWSRVEDEPSAGPSHASGMHLLSRLTPDGVPSFIAHHPLHLLLPSLPNLSDFSSGRLSVCVSFICPTDSCGRITGDSSVEAKHHPLTWSATFRLILNLFFRLSVPLVLKSRPNQSTVNQMTTSAAKCSKNFTETEF